jgi:hypothetical protein
VPNVELILGLVVAAAVLAGLARRLDLPDPVVLVLGGLALGLVPGLPSAALKPELVFLIFLPPLVYSAALQASTQGLRVNARPIGVLAIGLVLATMLTVAVAAHAAAGLAWGPAFVLGAVLGPTDPVAATAILRRLGAPDRIATILEGEALINDGTGLTVYKIAVTAAAGGSFALGEGVARFVLIAAGGVAIGAVAGWISTEIRRRIDEPTIETSISLLTAFLAYLPADRGGASGPRRRRRRPLCRPALGSGALAHHPPPDDRLLGSRHLPARLRALPPHRAAIRTSSTPRTSPRRSLPSAISWSSSAHSPPCAWHGCSPPPGPCAYSIQSATSPNAVCRAVNS